MIPDHWQNLILLNEIAQHSYLSKHMNYSQQTAAVFVSTRYITMSFQFKCWAAWTMWLELIRKQTTNDFELNIVLTLNHVAKNYTQSILTQSYFSCMENKCNLNVITHS